MYSIRLCVSISSYLMPRLHQREHEQKHCSRTFWSVLAVSTPLQTLTKLSVWIVCERFVLFATVWTRQEQMKTLANNVFVRVRLGVNAALNYFGNILEWMCRSEVRCYFRRDQSVHLINCVVSMFHSNLSIRCHKVLLSCGLHEREFCAKDCDMYTYIISYIYIYILVHTLYREQNIFKRVCICVSILRVNYLWICKALSNV